MEPGKLLVALLLVMKRLNENGLDNEVLLRAASRNTTAFRSIESVSRILAGEDIEMVRSVIDILDSQETCSHLRLLLFSCDVAVQVEVVILQLLCS